MLDPIFKLKPTPACDIAFLVLEETEILNNLIKNIELLEICTDDVI